MPPEEVAISSNRQRILIRSLVKMKILSPVDKIEEVNKLIDMGADELYCGVLTQEWHDKYIAGSINRRPGGGANFTTFKELERCVNIAHFRSIPVFLTLNEHYYIEEQYPFILDFVHDVKSIGVDAIIVADLALLLTLRQVGTDIKIIISTGGHTFNFQTARFYQELGASRIILPRHLTIEEIRGIRENLKDCELEVFIFNSRCPNIDGFCTFHHGLADQSYELLHKNACMLPYKISVYADDDTDTNQISLGRQYIWHMIHVDDYPCGACAIYEFKEMGITSLKIVGRGNATTRKIADVAFIRSLFNFLETERPEKDQFRKVTRKLYSKIYKRPCRIPMCYYPEVLI
jgi:putative protease